jgi:hypothetical protein
MPTTKHHFFQQSDTVLTRGWIVAFYFIFFLFPDAVSAQRATEVGMVAGLGTYTNQVDISSTGRSRGSKFALGGYYRRNMRKRYVAFSSEWLLTTAQYKHYERCPGWTPQQRTYKVNVASIELPLKLSCVAHAEHFSVEMYLGASPNFIYTIQTDPEYQTGSSLSSFAPASDFRSRNAYIQMSWLFGFGCTLPGNNRISLGMQLGDSFFSALPKANYICVIPGGMTSSTRNLIPLQSLQIQLNHAFSRNP